MFCLLVVLVKSSLLAKWLARKSPLRKPNCGEGIISIKPRPKSAHDFLGLLYCFIVLLCICVVSCPYVIYYPTVMARYSLFVLKVPLNPKQTNKQTNLESLWNCVRWKPWKFGVFGRGKCWKRCRNNSYMTHDHSNSDILHFFSHRLSVTCTIRSTLWFVMRSPP